MKKGDLTFCFNKLHVRAVALQGELEFAFSTLVDLNQHRVLFPGYIRE